jgi:hypothetical protein
MSDEKPNHPYWCDDCGGKAPFTIPGCEIDHDKGCPRENEDAMAVFRAAAEYCKTTGKAIK